MTTILLVEATPVDRERFGSWLEDAGYDVMVCPGPRGSDCVGVAAGACPLAAGADAVVLDLALGGDRLNGVPRRPRAGR